MNQESPSPKSKYHLPQVAIVGVVAAPWGFDGEVRVQPHTDNPKRFSKGSYLFAKGRALQIERCRWHQGLALIKFRGIETSEDAQRLQGLQLDVPLDEVPSLSSDSYYHFQILDMEVWTITGDFLGTVEDILVTGSNDVYVVRHGEDEVLVPAIQDVILEVDLEKGRMTVDLPEGLR
ncbi:MAG: ribosome maturation factor RimM [Chloroflexi bacterium]|nr:ribosome maturation factor RimM [Chloroflexota bacterium]